MITQSRPAVKEPVITIDTVLDAMDATWRRLDAALARFAPVLDDPHDAEGWTPRQLLSHLVGAWHRVPIHAAYYLTASGSRCPDVPVQLHDDYWMPEWAGAPLESFVLALKAAYIGNRDFVRELDPTALLNRARSPFGETSLAQMLLLSYKSHIGGVRLDQLEAFLRK